MSILLIMFFQDKGIPKEGLSPLIDVWEDDASHVVVTGTVYEISGGFYKYSFDSYNNTKNYSIRVDGGSVLSGYDRYITNTNETEYNTELTSIQADLDNPNQYKADVSALALEVTASGIKERTDNLPDDPADQSQIETAITTAEGNVRGADNDDLKTISEQIDTINIDTDYIETTVSGIKERTDNLPDSPAPADEYDSEFTTIQTDLDNPNQYKADVSALAIEANVEGHATDALNSYDSPTRAEATSDKNEIITEIDANEAKIDTIDGVVGTIKTDVEFIRKIEGGWWKLDAATNQMLFYDENGNGPIATFNLYNVDGVPSTENVYRRERI